MSNRPWLTLLVVFMVLLANPITLMAQDESATADETAIEESEGETDTPAEKEDELSSFFSVTTVTATGSEKSTFEISTSVSVIKSEEIEERLPDNAVDLFREEPGVDVNGVGPNQARPIIRGQRGLRVLFMENGLRLNNARRQSDFGEISGLIDVNSVETVEVVRGPASVLYGTDAIGGVLNLVSKSPAYGDGKWFGGAFDLRYGSAAPQGRGGLSLMGRNEKLSFNLGASYRDAENYDAPAGTFGDITLDEETEVVDTQVQDQSLFGFLGYDLNDRNTLAFRFNRYRAENAGFGLIPPEELQPGDSLIRILYPFQDFDRYTVSWVGSALGSVMADTVDTQLYWQNNERELVNDILINIGPIFPGAPNSDIKIDSNNFTDLETTGFRGQAIKSAGTRNLLTYGAELFQDDSRNTDTSLWTQTLRFPFPPFEQSFPIGGDDIPNAPNATNTSYGFFLQDEIAITPKFNATVGLRYQDVSTDAKETEGWDVTGLDFSDSTLVGALNLIYYVTPNLNVLGSYGTAFRAPNIIERLFNGLTPEGSGFQILNPDLVSEESDNYDIGLKYLRRNAVFELIYFHNEIDNGIIQYFLSEDEIADLPPDVQDQIEASGVNFVVQQRNIDKVRISGIEAVFGYRFNNGISLGGNWTDLDGERVDSDNPPTGETVTDKISGYLRYDQPKGRYWVEYRFRHNASQPTVLGENDPVPPVGTELPAFTVHTLAGGVTLWQKGRQSHRLGLVIENLTDELYAEFSNSTFFRPQPKRNVILNYRFGF